MNPVEMSVRQALLCMARQCWEQGLAAQAMLEMGDELSLILMARDCVVRQNDDGRLCDVEGTPALVDPAVCVEPVLAAGRLLGDETFPGAARRGVDYLLRDAPSTMDGARYQLRGVSEIWADSLGMGPHVLAAAGHVEDAFKMLHAIKARLYDGELGLYRHKWDEARGAFSRACCWGVGNGWALVGLMRMAIALKQAGDARDKEAAAQYLHLLDAVLSYQREDGLFHDVLDDPTSFVESEITEMVAYSIYKMVSWGYLGPSYLDRAEAARSGVTRRVDARGLVQGCAGSPRFEVPGTSPEGQAHFLMMESARRGTGLGMKGYAHEQTQFSRR